MIKVVCLTLLVLIYNIIINRNYLEQESKRQERLELESNFGLKEKLKTELY